MKNTFGQSLSVTLFGESHGEAIGAVIDGIKPGITVDTDKISSALAKRRPSSAIDTSRCEADNFKILSGVFNRKTTGTPIAIIIPNEDTKSRDYAKTYGLARPSHADYTAHIKYNGFEDYRGGGHFSGRITAALVAAGAIITSALEELGIYIGTHIYSCAGVCDRKLGDDIKSDIELLSGKSFPVLDDHAGEKMTEEILKAKSELDSVGGVAETAVIGMPAGVGEPWFDSIESNISHILFSLGGVKGVEFGTGFELAGMRASQCNDELRLENGNIITATNHNGGINGGISNGMPIIFRCAVKPTPSIPREQKTIDYINNENSSLAIEGRHDPAIIRRICPVINSVTAIAIYDMLAQRFGTELNGIAK